MGQIVSAAAKPKRCNANQLSQVPTPAAGEYILVSSDNSMNAAGQGNFDCYIEGDGTTPATALKLKSVDTFIGAFDISAYHATGDVLAKYADLSAALGANGANIPQSLRKGGMSVKFVQSSDNNYMQYRYMSTSTATTDFTNVANWQGVDIEPMAGSKNLVESGVLGEIVNQILRPSYTSIVGYINKNGVPNTTVTSFNRTSSISLKSGQRIVMHAAGYEQNVSMIAQETTDQSVFIPLVVCTDSNLGYYYYTNTSGQDVNVTLSYRTDKAFGFFITEIPYSDSVSYLAKQINVLKAENVAENVPHLKEVSINLNTYVYGTFVSSTGVKIIDNAFNNRIISKYYLKTQEVIKVSITFGTLYIVYYDENTNYLGYKAVNDASVESPKEIVISDYYPTAQYILVALLYDDPTYVPNVIFSKNATIENKEKIDSLEKGCIEVVSSNVTIDTTSHQGYINAAGNIAGRTQPYFYTDVMEFHKGDVIYLTSQDPAGSNVTRLSRWNADMTQCLKIIAAGTTTLTTYVYVVKDEVEYLVFCGNNNLTFYPFNVVKETYSYSTTFKSAIEEIAKPLVPDVTYKRHYSYAMWKVLCIGDSLTSGAYYSGTWGGNSIDENYPRILGRMIGGDVANGGHSGASASDYYLNDLDNFTLSDYDTFIIWLGTNGGLTDTLDTDVNPYTDYNDFASTNTGCYCKIIEKIKEAKPDAFIVLTKIFAGPSNPGVPTTNQVIDKIATKYSLMVIDNSDLSYVKHPELHANVSNNPHFGKAGNIVVANRVVDGVSNYLFADPIKAEFGLTARTN